MEKPREPNSNAEGHAFSANLIERVWLKAKPVPGFSLFRRDGCGALINRYDYGKETQHGWEIDHMNPVVHGGTDEIENLQPLHWENNRSKADDYPDWQCRRKC